MNMVCRPAGPRDDGYYFIGSAVAYVTGTKRTLWRFILEGEFDQYQGEWRSVRTARVEDRSTPYLYEGCICRVDLLDHDIKAARGLYV